MAALTPLEWILLLFFGGGFPVAILICAILALCGVRAKPSLPFPGVRTPSKPLPPDSVAWSEEDYERAREDRAERLMNGSGPLNPYTGRPASSDPY